MKRNRAFEKHMKREKSKRERIKNFGIKGESRINEMSVELQSKKNEVNNLKSKIQNLERAKPLNQKTDKELIKVETKKPVDGVDWEAIDKLEHNVEYDNCL